MKILFLQDFPLSAKGGGATIIKRLIQESKHYDVTVTLAYDVQSFGLEENQQIKSVPFSGLKRKYGFGIGRLISTLGLIGLDFRLNRKLDAIIKEEVPDVIHLTAHGMSFYSCARAAIRNKVPIVVSVHDIWQTTVGNLVPEKIFDRLFRKVLQEAMTVFPISAQMGQYLNDKYGPKKYIVIHDGISKNEYFNVINQPLEVNNTISFIYIGLLHEKQVKLLNLIIKSLGDFEKNKFEIIVCTNRNLELESAPENTIIMNKGWLIEPELMKLCSGCHYALLPLSFDARDSLLYKTSLMTKIPFYVKAGLPIFCVGPADSSAAITILEDKIGTVVSDDSEISMRTGLNEILNLADGERELISNNIEHARLNRFSLEIISSRFYNDIINKL